MSDMPRSIWAEYDQEGCLCAYDGTENGAIEYISKAAALLVIALAKTVLQYVDRYEDLTDSNREDVACALSAIAAFEDEVTG